MSPQEFAKTYALALAAGDLGEITALHAPNVVMVDTWDGTQHTGADTVSTFLGRLVESLRPHWLVDAIIATDEGFALSWVVGGFHVGTFDGMPATGRPFTVTGATLAEVRDGAIVRRRDFWNRHALRSQLQHTAHQNGAGNV